MHYLSAVPVGCDGGHGLFASLLVLQLSQEFAGLGGGTKQALGLMRAIRVPLSLSQPSQSNPQPFCCVTTAAPSPHALYSECSAIAGKGARTCHPLM